jgi:hypothetical protein
MLIGLVTFVWSTWSLAVAFENYVVLLWLVRLLAIVGAGWMIYSFREHLPGWASGAEMPLLSAVGVLGAGIGMAMVMAFLLKADYFVLGIWSGLDTLFGGDVATGLYELRAQLLTAGIIALTIIGYFVNRSMQRSKGVKVEYAFKEIPPE